MSHPMPATYSGSNWTGKIHVVASVHRLESLFSLRTISPQLLGPPQPSQGPPWCQPTSLAPQVGDFFLQIFLLLCVLSHSVTQSTVRDPMDCSPPGSSVHGILQARMEWVTMPSSRDFPTPRIEPRSPALQVNSLLCEPPGKPPDPSRKPQS